MPSPRRSYDEDEWGHLESEGDHQEAERQEVERQEAERQEVERIKKGTLTLSATLKGAYKTSTAHPFSNLQIFEIETHQIASKTNFEYAKGASNSCINTQKVTLTQ